MSDYFYDKYYYDRFSINNDSLLNFCKLMLNYFHLSPNAPSVSNDQLAKFINLEIIYPLKMLMILKNILEEIKIIYIAREENIGRKFMQMSLI